VQYTEAKDRRTVERDHQPGTVDQVCARLDTSAARGLTTRQARERLQSCGPNELREKAGKNPLRLLVEQLASTMVLILLAAAALSAALGKSVEAVSILVIVVMFAAIGFFQEHRAERAIAALRRMAVPAVRVRRDGALTEVPAVELVPGDIVLLEAGNIVPADLRLVEAAGLRLQEAALTGESEPVDKDTEPLDLDDLPLGDRRNAAFMGTTVSAGRGAGVVTATGMTTELGRVAVLIQQVAPRPTPLQTRLDRLGRLLAVLGAAAAGLVLLIGLAVHEPLTDMVLTALSVAVAVVPEGLPAVVTITLSLGAQRMLRRRALIRRLPAVETLGSITVICSDKTGTLTENRMTVMVVDVAGHSLQVTEELRHRQPSLDLAPGSLSLEGRPQQIAMVLAAGVLCNDASLRREPEAGRVHALGDPTEAALLIAAARAGLMQDALAPLLPRVAEAPFDSTRRRMTTVHALPSAADRLPAGATFLSSSTGERLVVTKGSADGLLEACTRVSVDDRLEPLDEAWRARVRQAVDRFSRQGMRVLGFAYRRDAGHAVPSAEPSQLERDLVFVGLAAMIDPPRAEAREAVARCREAGIRPVMITGDHPLTAAAIAADLGIAADSRALVGRELAAMGSDDMRAATADVAVYARVSPEDKLTIVEALQHSGEVVAMTGDGVNDSPALRRADIGVAMGITGTDAAKQAADMVLLDDNFATIVAAVEEGRVIYDNLLRFVKFSVGGNLGKVITMLLGPLAGVGVALEPLQLLWLNLLTDGLMGLALGVEPAEGDVMRRPPRSPRTSLFAGGVGVHMAWSGTLIGVLTLAAGAMFAHSQEARSVMFTTLAATQIGHALGLKSLRRPGTRGGVLALAAAGVAALQAAALFAPFLKDLFGVGRLTPVEVLVAAGFGALTYVTVEIEKRIRRGH
jgi:P-type Ca2+ transporter type 2C